MAELTNTLAVADVERRDGEQRLLSAGFYP